MTSVEETTWIPICCVCHQVRDDRQSHECHTRNGFATWMSLRSFLHLYGIPRGSYQLTHTYCEQCMGQQGFDQPTPGEEIGYPPVLQEQLRLRIISIGSSSN